MVEEASFFEGRVVEYELSMQWLERMLFEKNMQCRPCIDEQDFPLMIFCGNKGQLRSFNFFLT